jgi:hypothetical protein
MKIQITCTRCGFVAFVDAHALAAESRGWASLSVNAQRSLYLGGICPACIGEEQPESAPPARARTA